MLVSKQYFVRHRSIRRPQAGAQRGKPPASVSPSASASVSVSDSDSDSDSDSASDSDSDSV